VAEDVSAAIQLHEAKGSVKRLAAWTNLRNHSVVLAANELHASVASELERLGHSSESSRAAMA